MLNAERLGESAKSDMPIVATLWYGQGQVVYLGTDETWRWRFNVQDKHFIRFWGQIIYQFGLPSLLGDSAKRGLSRQYCSNAWSCLV